MSIRALFSSFFLMLLAGCIVRAQSPDAAPAEVGARDAIDGCNVDAPVMIGCSTPEEGWDEVCDPVCQTGDCNWCTQKCTYGKDGKPYCGLKQNTEKLKGLMERCEVFRENDNQIDNCAPGLVCLRPIDGDIDGYCFRPCRLPANDCKQGDSVYECAFRPLAPKVSPYSSDKVLDKVLACNPSPTLNCKNNICCDPTRERRSDGGSDNANCAENQVCRLLEAALDGSSRTTCDLGAGDNGSSCSSNVDCAARHACIDFQGKSQCRRICIPGAEESTCTPPSQYCEKHSEQYGFCFP